MKQPKYRFLIGIVVFTLFLTITIQLYWNALNFYSNKQRLQNEIQLAVDNALELYFKEVSLENQKFYKSLPIIKNTVFVQKTLDPKNLEKIQASSIKKILIKNQVAGKASIKITGNYQEISSFHENKTSTEKTKSTSIAAKKKFFNDTPSIGSKFFKSKIHVLDSASFSKNIALENLATKIIISMVQDSIDLKKLAGFVEKELARKNIEVVFGLNFKQNENQIYQWPSKSSVFNQTKQKVKSLLLPKEQSLYFFYENPLMYLFKKSAIGIGLSFLLSLLLILCLFYLLKTINKQKKINEIKNDLISNITHEFKTPITTIGTAIEGIKLFNSENDKQKTERYLDISQQQLGKLTTMVEKFLETATLDSDDFRLDFETQNITELLEQIITEHQLNAGHKKITFETVLISKKLKIDLFHFENAISNLIDNALKYGGNHIKIKFVEDQNLTKIIVSDDGLGISKVNQSQIFDKFFRVPTGNVHQVKGFGIGLFYTKKIIEKHGATIRLDSVDGLTNFIISFPNAK